MIKWVLVMGPVVGCPGSTHQDRISSACLGRVCPDRMKPVGMYHYGRYHAPQYTCECHAGDVQ